jgi:cytochrome c-type biogenesis protein CcmE
MNNRKLIVELMAIVAANATISTLILIALDQSNFLLSVPWTLS